ncbi:MAG: ATP-binding protein [Candidatus Eisenbacteria bacterium]|jgi:predicted AAA+ superfamily ATPase|nr:ATP-binding protein [Candidatus Eisenbacteria bacterium]
MHDRWLSHTLARKIERPFVHLLFGPRQAGKSTLLAALLPEESLVFDLSDPTQRARLLADPGEFIRVCRALPERRASRVVFVDEAQTVPALFDAVQHLYDQDKQRWRFVLCGSSARRLRTSGANLLPGRSFLHHLHPLILAEQPSPARMEAESPLSFPWTAGMKPASPFPAWDLEPRLAYGALPGVVTADERDRADILHAYAAAYLEEEIRREATVRDWGVFLRFLRFAARESGGILNYTAVAQEAGTSPQTVKAYYQMLVDMFVGFLVPAFSRSPRKNLLSTPRFLFFDLGVRHAAAGLTPSPHVIQGNPGSAFEQWVGLELWKRLQYLGDGQLHYFRTRSGAEVDFVIEREARLTPIEVKWTERPTARDARHLLGFIRDHPDETDKGYVICRCPRPQMLAERVVALPWFCL